MDKNLFNDLKEYFRKVESVDINQFNDWSETEFKTMMLTIINSYCEANGLDQLTMLKDMVEACEFTRYVETCLLSQEEEKKEDEE